MIKGIGRVAYRAAVRFFDHNGPDRAAAVAYYTLLSLLPLLIFLISLGSYVLDSWDAAYQRALFLLQGVLAHTDKLTLEAMRQFAEQATRFQAPSIIILAWTAKRGFSSLLTALEVVFSHSRSIAKANLHSLAMVAITGAGLLLTMLLATVIATGQGLIKRFAPGAASAVGGLVAYLLTNVLPVVVTIAFLYILYRMAAPSSIAGWRVAAGALLATFLWELGKAGFAWYLRNLARYAGLYGALEGVIVLAIWLELSVSIVLYGAEVVALTSALEPRRPVAPASVVQPLTTARVGE